MAEKQSSISQDKQFSFFKGGENVIALKDGCPLDWEDAATKVRAHLNDAMNARHVAFLLGSGCSSFYKDDEQVGIPTMVPMARTFLEKVGENSDAFYATQAERVILQEKLGLNLKTEEYAQNLERLLEVLYSFQFIIKRSTNESLKSASEAVNSVIKKVTRYISKCCLEGAFSNGDESVLNLYQAFYRKLIYRDRSLPRPWIFTTNYDLFNETAMDRLGIPYSNGFSGTVERRFNSATFRYSLAEQLDISSNKWTSVDSYIYLCKLHGSINWIEEGKGLFPFLEIQQPLPESVGRVMIYPTPAKQSASFGSPYSDLFREFQNHVVRDQSVLFVLGYGFGDEHINNIIFQALTIPTFRMVTFLPPDITGVAAQLRELADPRVWIIGGDGPVDGRLAHYFDTFVEKFMPEPPSNKVDTAVAKILQELLAKSDDSADRGGGVKNGD